MKGFVEIQMESLDEGVIDSLKVSWEDLKQRFNKAKIDFKKKLSIDKKRVILNAAEVALLFLPTLSSKLSREEVEILANAGDRTPEVTAPVVYKVLQELAKQGYIKEEPEYFVIPPNIVKTAGLAGVRVNKANDSERGKLKSEIKVAEKDLEVTKTQVSEVEKKYQDTKKQYDDIAAQLDELKRVYRDAYKKSILKDKALKMADNGLRRQETRTAVAEERARELERSLKALEKELIDTKSELGALKHTLYQQSKDVFVKKVRNKNLVDKLAIQSTGRDTDDSSDVGRAVQRNIDVSGDVNYMTESVTMAGVALTKVVVNLIKWLVIGVLAYRFLDRWREDYFSVQREALKINKKIFSYFGVSVNLGPVSFKAGSQSSVGGNEMEESLADVIEDAEFIEDGDIEDLDDGFVFDESELDEYFPEEVDESFIDGAVSKAKLIKKIYNLFAVGAIKVTGSKIVIDTNKFGVTENE